MSIPIGSPRRFEFDLQGNICRYNCEVTLTSCDICAIFERIKDCKKFKSCVNTSCVTEKINEQINVVNK